MKKIYFAHPFDTRGTKEEKQIIKLLSGYFEIVNPYDKECMLEEKYGGPYYDLSVPLVKSALEFRSLPISTCLPIYNKQDLILEENKVRDFASDIVVGDFHMLMNSDAYLGYFPTNSNHRSIGSAIELLWAHKYEKHPIMIIDEKVHPFLLHYSDAVFPNIYSFAKDISKVMGRFI